ncbi:PAS domain-containing sensor histidine kinase [Spirosoma pollinicola]|uniref:histidine kinase n=1 Tax=Spirosoma pollinicola TaxID=2057025 RepID=A0A2K8Z0V2_9BACT|nr:PAS domain-containing protein [Spirosoma pollinicola]AUD03507.1 hypothetical protein CWM47_17730 [Spirosoma pollinicola]
MLDEQTPSHHDKALAERVDLDFALQAAGLGVWEIDLTTNLIRWDQRCQALFGLTASNSDQLRYQEAIRGIHPDDIERVRLALQAAMNPSTDRPFDLTCRTIGAEDRQLRWIRFTGRSYFSQTGQPLRLAGIAHDITRQVDEQLQAQQTAQHLQAVLDSSPAVISFLKPVLNETGEVVNFVLVVCNQRLAQLSQKSIDQLRHQSFTQLSHILWQNQTFTNLLYVLQTGEPFYQEQPEQTPQGERWFSISVTKWDGGVVLTGLDISPLKESQRQLQQGLGELNEFKESRADLQALLALVQQRGELLRAASHDLRGNLNILSGVIGLLEINVQPNERIPPMLELMRRNVRQAAQMITNLLDYVRLEEGQEQLNPAVVDVSDLLTGLVRGIKSVALEKGLMVTATGPKRLLVEGDALNLNRIGQNLFLTVIKFTTQGPLRVSWDVDPDQDWWWFSVANIASDEELLHTLQEELTDLSGHPATLEHQSLSSAFPTPQTTAKGRSGDEIGLRIVRQLVGLLRAKFQVKREPDGGVKLIVSLPISYSSPTQ